MKRPSSCVLVFSALSTLVLAGAPAAQKTPPAGKMWLYEELPKEHLAEVYGFEVTDEWIEHARSASVIYGGGSASFVSPRGLILTNHHVVRGQVEAMEHDGKNLNTHGYAARALSEELSIPGASARIVVAARDVTEEILGGVDLDLPLAERRQAINAKRQIFLEAARKEYPGLDVSVTSMYRGARVHLYAYRVYDDIRLVFSPHLAVAYFGGHGDNFSYPHHAIDFALVRAYEDGQPADTSENHFEFRAEPLEEGELVFVSGYPGSTDRHMTVAEVELQRDARYRAQAAGFGAFGDALYAYLEENPDRAESLRETELSIANVRKSFDGIYHGLLDDSRMREEKRAEKDLRKRIDADPDADPRWEIAFEEIEAVCEELTDVYLRWWYRSPQYAPGQNFGPLARAMSVVEDVHPEFYGTTRVNAPTGGLRFEFEPELFAKHIERAREVLGADDPAVQALLNGREPEEAVAYLMENTNITSNTFEKELVAGGWEAVSVSDDPFIQAALVIYPLYVESAEEKELLEEVIAHQSFFVGQAIDAMNGPVVCPEATRTLRFSPGVVAGYEQLGTEQPFATSFYGMFGRCVEFGDQGAYDLPDVWWESIDEIDLAAQVNLVATVDIIGGNSGSPLLDRQSRVVGTVFDGNLQMVENQFLYRDEQSRTVAVVSPAILETLRKVYDAPTIADELVGEGGHE